MLDNVIVTLTKEDIWKLQLSYFKRQSYPWILGFLYMLSILNIVVAIVDGDISSLNPFMIFIFIFVPLLIFFFIRISRRNMENRFVREEKKYTWSVEGLVMESESVTARMLWTDFTDVIATRTAIYLMVNNVTAHLFPRRSFTEEQWCHFQKITKGRIKRKKSFRWLKSLIIYLILFVVTVGVVQYYLAK